MDSINWEIQRQNQEIQELSRQAQEYRQKGSGQWVYIDAMLLQKKRYVQKLKSFRP